MVSALTLILGFMGPHTIHATQLGQPSWWPRYEGKHQAQLLDGEWAFGFTADDLNSLAASSKAVATTNNTHVPSTVDAAPPGYYGRRGVSFYSRNFETENNTTYKIQFMGCAFYCKVWIDDELVGANRAGGYAPWSVEVPPTKTGTRSLTVLADNRFNSTTAPLHTGGDFWHYGGIVRSVVLHSFPSGAPTVWRAHIFPELLDTWHVNISVLLTHNFTGDLQVSLDWKWSTSAASNMTAVARAGVASLIRVQVPADLANKEWSFNTPHLQVLSVSANGGGVTERFGLRTWSVETSPTTGHARIALNGNIVKLLGYNHHTQWPLTGMSPTEGQLDEDIGLLARAGANMVRGGHYPQDQRWLDRLDEAGIAMWEEALGPGVGTEDTLDADFMSQQLIQLDQMLDASLNHPSILTWGYFNEGPSGDVVACPSYKICANKIKSRDSTRFVTWASNKINHDVCLDSATLISFNGYPGWYSDEGNASAPVAFWNEMADWVHENYPTVPFMISETGAGGIYEWNDNVTDVIWSLNYQEQVVTADVQTVIENSQISSLTIWHFFDFKAHNSRDPIYSTVGNDDAQANGPCNYLPNVYPPICGYINVTDNTRPGGLNHKGAVDFWRRTKPSFYTVAMLFTSASTAA